MTDIAQQLGLRPEHFQKEDGTMALLVYVAGLVGVLLIHMDDKKKLNPYLKFHMTQSVALIVIGMIVGLLTCGVGSFVYMIMAFVYGLKAMKGEVFEIPFVTGYCLKNGHFDGVKELTAGGGMGHLPPGGMPPQGPGPGGPGAPPMGGGGMPPQNPPQGGWG